MVGKRGWEVIGNEGAIYLEVVGCIILVFLLIFFLLMLDGGRSVSIYPRGGRQQAFLEAASRGDGSVCLSVWVAAI